MDYTNITVLEEYAKLLNIIESNCDIIVINSFKALEMHIKSSLCKMYLQGFYYNDGALNEHNRFDNQYFQ